MSSHLSDKFFADLAAMGDRRGSDPAIFLVVWCVESNLNPAAMNSIGARGLNQFLPSTLASLGAPADFEKLSGEEQLPWIEKFIANGEHRNGGPFKTAARYYHSRVRSRSVLKEDGDSNTCLHPDRGGSVGRANVTRHLNHGVNLRSDCREPFVSARFDEQAGKFVAAVAAPTSPRLISRRAPWILPLLGGGLHQ